MDTESIITGEETIEEIIGAIKNGFGEDHSALIPLYYDKTEDQKKKSGMTLSPITKIWSPLHKKIRFRF